MLIVFVRSIIIFVMLFLLMRLMGKRELGELQPFEFVATLAVADLACSPMSSTQTPLYFGLIPIATLFILHFVITRLSSKFVKFRRKINGKPFIIIDQNGIDYPVMQKLNMNVSDLFEGIRDKGFFSIEEVAYAIVETNGKMSVMGKENPPEVSGFPVLTVSEGQFIEESIRENGIDKESILIKLKSHGTSLKDTLMVTVENKSKMIIQTKTGTPYVEYLEA